MCLPYFGSSWLSVPPQEKKLNGSKSGVQEDTKQIALPHAERGAGALERSLALPGGVEIPFYRSQRKREILLHIAEIVYIQHRPSARPSLIPGER